MTKLEQNATTILRNGSTIIMTLPLNTQSTFNSTYSADVILLHQHYSSVIVIFVDTPNIQMYVASN